MHTKQVFLVLTGEVQAGPNPKLTSRGIEQMMNLGRNPCWPRPVGLVIVGTGTKYVQSASLCGLTPSLYSANAGGPDQVDWEGRTVTMVDGINVPIFKWQAPDPLCLLQKVADQDENILIFSDRSFVFGLEPGFIDLLLKNSFSNSLKIVGLPILEDGMVLRLSFPKRLFDSSEVEIDLIFSPSEYGRAN